MIWLLLSSQLSEYLIYDTNASQLRKSGIWKNGLVGLRSCETANNMAKKLIMSFDSGCNRAGALAQKARSLRQFLRFCVATVYLLFPQLFVATSDF